MQAIPVQSGWALQVMRRQQHSTTGNERNYRAKAHLTTQGSAGCTCVMGHRIHCWTTCSAEGTAASASATAPPSAASPASAAGPAPTAAAAGLAAAAGVLCALAAAADAFAACLPFIGVDAALLFAAPAASSSSCGRQHHACMIPVAHTLGVDGADGLS